MRNIDQGPQRLRLGLTPGALSTQLSTLLALQHAQEPETDLTMSEVQSEELTSGLGEGHYDAGLSLQEAALFWINSEPLWHEDLVAALPPQSPLLEHAALNLTDLQEHSIFRWSAEACPALDSLWSALQSRRKSSIRSTTSFELLVLRVAAGQGIGISARSRVEQADAWGIVLRPLLGGPYKITTHLLKSSNVPSLPALTRFERRARVVFSH